MTTLQMIAKLLPILIQIESGGDQYAVGDEGRAVGILQIHKCVVDDVNRIYKLNFRYSDRWDVRKSKRIAVLYLQHWVRYQPKVDMEVLARTWVGGPMGPQKASSLAYALKVKTLLNPME